MADTGSTFDEYVTWYSWAGFNLAPDAVACHAAAMAATAALDTGLGRQAAAAAARAAVGNEAALDHTRATYSSKHRYVEWFVWARSNLRLPDPRCHEAAQAALDVIAAGGSQPSAVEAAMRLLMPPTIGSSSQRPSTTTKGTDLASAGRHPALSFPATTHKQVSQSESSPVRPLVVRYGWHSLRFGILAASTFVLLGIVGLVGLLQIHPRDTGVLLLLISSASFIGVGLIGLLNDVIPAARHSLALAVYDSGIVLKPGPVLGRHAAWGRAPNRTILWSDVVAVHVGDLTVETAYPGASGRIPMTVDVPMMDIQLRDGAHVLRDLKGVQCDRRQLADAIARFAPSVRFVEGRILRPPRSGHSREWRREVGLQLSGRIVGALVALLLGKHHHD